MLVNKYPKCSAAIQASLKIYLGKLELVGGRITGYEISPSNFAFAPAVNGDPIRSMIETADPGAGELAIYCANDHKITVLEDGEVEAE